jgi:hypothetical protein
MHGPQVRKGLRVAYANGINAAGLPAGSMPPPAAEAWNRTALLI